MEHVVNADESFSFEHEIAGSYSGERSKTLVVVVMDGCLGYKVVANRRAVLLTSDYRKAVERYNDTPS